MRGPSRSKAKIAAEDKDVRPALAGQEPARDLKFAFKFRSLTKLVADLIKRGRENQEEHFDYVGMLMNARDKETGDAMTERALRGRVPAGGTAATAGGSLPTCITRRLDCNMGF